MKKEAFRAAFPHTIPVMTGYLFLGMAYGIYMRVSGFPFWYPLLTSVIVYGGSLEFLLVTILLAPYAPLATFLMALMLQARHLFYGLAMLDRYKHLGKKRYYLIYALTDETFSVNCSTEVPEGIDEGWFMF
ncbi:MAG: AzlC family ABC transporter permease, partial [Erysipelotrichaceae bacterium]|nr:AzlC family ABC transporter permease [Erysipelotrichaceae bacterium]